MMTHEAKSCSECGQPAPVPYPPFGRQCGTRMASKMYTSDHEPETIFEVIQTKATNDNALAPVINDDNPYDVTNVMDIQIEPDRYSDYYGLDEFFP